MRTVDSMWFNNPKGSFGIVVGEDPYAGRKIYAGIVRGVNIRDDERYLLAYGNKVNVEALKKLIALYEFNPERK